ncbi:hypothetical protein DB347_15430 [Opitutaceae bacterium EW11]|nr:hypothetical protein DB347_15430 [Opitutaceae bacterium EW11]
MRTAITYPVRWSFRAVVLLGTLSLAVGVVVVLTALLNYYNGRQVQALANALLSQKLAHIEGRVNELLTTAERQGQVCLEITPQGGLRADQFLEVFSQLAASFAQQTDFTYLGYASETTGEYAMLERLSRKEFRLRTYTVQADGSRAIRDYRYDRNKFILERTSPWTDYDPRVRPFYQLARTAGEATWTASYPFPANDRRAAARGISHAVPVYDSRNNLQGVWDVDLDTLSLSAFLRSQLGGSGDAFVVERGADGRWTLIAHPLLTEGEQAPLLQPNDPRADRTASVLLESLDQNPRAKEHRTFEFHVEKSSQLAAWTYLSNERFPRWLLAASIPEASARSSLAGSHLILLIVLATAVACAVLAIVLSRLIARPVERLRAAVERYTSDGTIEPVPVSGPVEILRLSRAFNTMSTAVSQRERELVAANKRLEGEVRERSLREAELEAIFANAPIEMWAVNEAGYYTMMSQGMRLRCGDLRGQHPLKSTLPAEVAGSYDANNRRALAGETIRGESSEDLGGGTRYFNWILAPIRINGVVTSALGVSLDVTDRRRAEDALRESQQRLKLHLENTPLAVIDWSTDYTVLSWNPAAEAVFGWPAADALGKHGLFLVPAPDQPAALRSWNDLLQRRGGFRDYTKNVTRDGRTIDCEWYDTVITDEAGKVIGVSSLVLDVTQRISAERLFEESELRFVSAFRDSPVAKLISRYSDGEVLDVNNAFLSMFGQRRENVVGHTAIELGLWGNAEERTEFLQAIEREGMLRDRERHFVRPDGGTFDVLHSTGLLPLGSELCLMTTIVDNTNRKAAETALREQQRFLSSLISHLPGMVYRCQNDEQSTINFLSDGAEELTGYVSRDLVSGADRSLWSLLPPDDRQHRRQIIAEALAGGERSYSDEYRLIHRTGEVRWMWERGEGVTNDQGAVEYLVGYITDITARKEAEEEVLKLNLTLERRVRDRTVELASANEKLKELDRLKSQFLATMSHELRTPLNSIIGFSTLLSQGIAGPLNPEQHKQIELVRSSARHLLGLINDLLDLSRIESDRVELYLEDFDVADVLREVEATLAPMVAQKKLAFLVQPGPGLILHTDRKRVYQVALNLANNAVKFTERGSVQITSSAEGEGVRIDVRDTGIGIRADQMPMLFEAFRQLDGSARRVYEGTGLGLHLCRKLLDLLGGRVEVQSTFGQGSCFTVFLPRRPPPTSPIRS